MPKIYLASASPRRAELLPLIGVEFEVLKLGEFSVDEAVHGREAPATYVQRLAREKAQAGVRAIAARGLAARPVLGADTTVCVGREILGKPGDAADREAEAARMLRLLSGRTHRVLTAVALATPKSVRVALSDSRVTFRRLTRAEISAYIATGEPFDKAGGYGIQGPAAAFVSHLSGSYTGVMGLPLFETAQLLGTP
ncbi:MAG TPA: Maf family protein [Burkholderiales bacterium]|jgi:septum formation protein|nr:Maf family protein [Burkholderiales bacterium]